MAFFFSRTLLSPLQNRIPIYHLTNTNQFNKIYNFDSSFLSIHFDAHNFHRFSKSANMQIFDGDSIIFIPSKTDIMEVIKKDLETHQKLKIMHDCKNAVSFLHHNFNIDIKNIFDVQFAHSLHQKNTQLLPASSKLINILKFYFPSRREAWDDIFLSEDRRGEEERGEGGIENDINISATHTAKLATTVFEMKSIFDVLRKKLLDETGDMTSQKLNYQILVLRELNSHIRSRDGYENFLMKGDRDGNQILMGMVENITRDAITFHLNLPQKGIVRGVSNCWKFEGCELGDVIELSVKQSTVSQGNFLSCERYIPPNAILHFDRKNQKHIFI